MIAIIIGLVVCIGLRLEADVGSWEEAIADAGGFACLFLLVVALVK